MAGGSVDLSNRSDMPLILVPAGSELVPVLKTDGTPGAILTASLQSASASVNLAYPSWAALSAVPGTTVNQKAEVFDDAGTHVDPTTTGVVSNSGVFAWRTAGWTRISDAASTNALNVANAASASATTANTGLAAQAIELAGLSAQVAALALNPGDSQDVQDQLQFLSDQITTISNALARDIVGPVALLSQDFRPGDNPFFYSVDYIGSPVNLLPIDSQFCVQSAYGKVYRRRGSTLAASRKPYWIEPGRTYGLRYRFARQATPTDPAGDAIQCGVAWLDYNYALISTLIVSSLTNITSSLGEQGVFATIPSRVGDPVAVNPPSGAVYFRPFIQTFGPDGVTDLIEIVASDITDLSVYAPSLTTVNTRLSALETSVASLQPLSAGTPGGLATLDANGQLAQLPLSRGRVFNAMRTLFPTVVNASVSDFASTISDFDHMGTDYIAFYVDRDAPLNGTLYNLVKAYLKKPYPSPALSDSDATTKTNAIWAAAATGGVAPSDTTPVTGDAELNDDRFHAAFNAYILGLPPARGYALSETQQKFATISGASYADFLATISDVGNPGADYFAVHEWRDAPVNGTLYNLVKAYLMKASPAGPALSGAAASTAVQQIWTAAAVDSYPTGA